MKPSAWAGPGRRAGWAALAVAALLVACSANEAETPATPGPTYARVRAAGTVRIGYANEAPYAYLDSASGRVTGEAPEIARHVLAELGIQHIEPVLTEFGSLIPGLQAGRFDLIAAGMYVLPKRCHEVRFSNPTYSVGEALAVRKGNPQRLHSYADIAAHPAVKLGVVAGTAEIDHARAAHIPAERILFFPGAPGAVAGVEAGRVDAAAGTAMSIRDLVTKTRSGRIEVAKPFTDPEFAGRTARGYGAFAFRKADADFADAFDAALAKFIGTPAHAAMVRRFGFTTAELPGKATTRELCEG